MATEHGLKRRLGFGLLTLYGVGVMVGAGIYVLIGTVAGAVGTWAPLAFLVAGLVALPTALSYAELSVRIPESAGEAAYLRAATGSVTFSSAIGMAVAAVGIVSAAAVLQGGVGYLRTVLDVPNEVLITAFGMLLAGIAIAGVVESLAVAAVLTCIEVIGLAVVVVVAFIAAPATQPPEAAVFPEQLAISGAVLLAFFAFIGFEDMVNMAEETRDPTRTMPRAIIAALAVTTVLYALVAWAAVRAVPVNALGDSQSPLALVFTQATGRSADALSMIAVAAAVNGVLAQIVMAARVLYGLGRHAPLFAMFHHSHPRFGTPVTATVLSAALVIILALTAPLVALASVTSLVLLTIFTAINGALIVLRWRKAAPAGQFSVPGWVPWVGALLSIAALIGGAVS